MILKPSCRFRLWTRDSVKIATGFRAIVTSSQECRPNDAKFRNPDNSELGLVKSLNDKGEQAENMRPKPWAERLEDIGHKFRLPRSVQAIYLRPLRRKPNYGLPVCDLQLRSYSLRNLEFFADFALRAAYYLNLPISGPVPLPRIVERWTVPRSNFVHKKSQENFERITLRRLIQVKDGHQDTVQIWLAFLRKHAFYGVGMKANVWEFDDLDVSKSMDIIPADVEKELEACFSNFGYRSDAKPENISHIINGERFSNSSSPLTELRNG